MLFHSLLCSAERCGWEHLWPQVPSAGLRGHFWPLYEVLPCHTGHGPGAGAQRGELAVPGVREPQAALICTPGWDLAGAGGASLFPDNFLLSCHPPDQQDRQPRLKFLLDSLLEWKKLVCGVWAFQNVLFHFKGVSIRRNWYGQLQNIHTESTPKSEMQNEWEWAAIRITESGHTSRMIV